MSVWRDDRKLVFRLDITDGNCQEQFRVVVSPPDEGGETPPDVTVERETTDTIGDPLWKAATPRQFTTVLALALAHFANATNQEYDTAWRTHRWNLGCFIVRGDVYCDVWTPDAPQDR